MFAALPSRHRHAVRPLCWLMPCLAAFAGSAAIAAESADEYRLKAAFMYHFTQFVDWPAGAFASAEAPFTICVFGADPFGEALKALEKRNVKGRPIAIAYPRSAAETQACRILYSDATDRNLIKTLGEAPVLSVTSRADAAEAGFGIGFVAQGDKVRWMLNLDAARRAQLKLSAKLIEIAVTVVGETGKP